MSLIFFCGPLLGKDFGEVPKLAEGTPLERVQVVNSGARVQIPPSPLLENVSKNFLKKILKKLLTREKQRDIVIKLTAKNTVNNKTNIDN